MSRFSGLLKILRRPGIVNDAAKVGGDALQITVRNGRGTLKLVAGTFAGTAVGTYLLTAYGKIGSVTESVSNILGIPQSVTVALVSLGIVALILWLIARIVSRSGRRWCCS